MTTTPKLPNKPLIETLLNTTALPNLKKDNGVKIAIILIVAYLILNVLGVLP